MSFCQNSPVSTCSLPTFRFGAATRISDPGFRHEAVPTITALGLGGKSCPGSQEWSIAICDGIIDLLALLFEVESKQLRSPRRTTKPVARVRQIGMYIAHVTFGMRMTDVGVGFGRDKSTILYACHLIEDMRDDADFDMIVGRVENILTTAFALGKHDPASRRSA